jgi:hypothetical protein
VVGSVRGRPSMVVPTETVNLFNGFFENRPGGPGASRGRRSRRPRLASVVATHQLASAYHSRCRTLEFMPWKRGTRSDPVVGRMGISRQESPTKHYGVREDLSLPSKCQTGVIRRCAPDSFCLPHAAALMNPPDVYSPSRTLARAVVPNPAF